LTDGKGRTVDFKNTVIIMTSNIGSQYIRDLQGDDEEIKKRVIEALRSHFRPEFLNRVDETILFNSLGLEEIKKIVDLQVERLRKRLTEKHIEISLTDAAKEYIAREGFDPAYGARPLRRAIERDIQNPLALRLLEGEFPEGSRVKVDLDAKSGGLKFKKS
ncbi:MAG: AAA family ATPase, partial [bacterium]